MNGIDVQVNDKILAALIGVACEACLMSCIAALGQSVIPIPPQMTAVRH